MTQVWRLALNDLRLTLRDRPAFIWMLAMPIAMMWFFGGMGGDGSSASPQISLSLVNHDEGWLSTALIDELKDERIRLEQLNPEEFEDSDKVRTMIIPEQFTRGVLSGEPQVLRLVKEAGSNQGFGIAAQVHITRAMVRSLGRLVEMDPLPATDDAGQLLERFRELGRRESPVKLEVTSAGEGRPVPGGFAQSVPGMLTFIVMMMTLIYGGVFLTVEKQEGMLRRQASLPLSRGRIFMGKLTGRLLLAAMQIVLLVLAGRFLFGLSWGSSPSGLALALVSFTVAVAGLSTLLGAVLSTPQQASSVGWIGSMVMAALGGCWWPSEVMPPWLWKAAHVLPTAWAMDAFHALISFGRGLDAVLLPSGVLLGFGALTAALGARFLRFDS